MSDNPATPKEFYDEVKEFIMTHFRPKWDVIKKISDRDESIQREARLAEAEWWGDLHLDSDGQLVDLIGNCPQCNRIKELRRVLPIDLPPAAPEDK
jgi:hypothetical protein